MNKIILILSLSNLDESKILYYENLVNEIKQTYANEIDVLLTLNSMQEFDGNISYNKIGNEIYEFGCSNADVTNQLIKKYESIYRNKTIITPNRGWDVGQFLIGLKHIGNQYEYVYHVHSKKHKTWRDKLLSIKDTNILKLNADTVSSRENFVWVHEDLLFPLDVDKNLDILRKHDDLFPHENLTTWGYISGKIFTTRYDFLKPLVDGFEKIYSLLTDRNKDDVFWCEHMDDEEYYDGEFSRLENCPWNLPMTPGAREMRKKYNARNYFELLERGYRGIPDLQIEHAIERYIGYLICYNKDIYFPETDVEQRNLLIEKSLRIDRNKNDNITQT